MWKNFEAEMKKEKNINIQQKEKEEKKKQAEKDKKIKKLKSKQTENAKMIDLDVLEKPAEKNFGGMYLSDILKPVLFLVFAIVFEMVNFAFKQPEVQQRFNFCQPIS